MVFGHKLVHELCAGHIFLQILLSTFSTTQQKWYRFQVHLIPNSHYTDLLWFDQLVPQYQHKTMNHNHSLGMDETLIQ